MAPADSKTPLRLTQIKLAGFKSFVDPTTIGTPGQLVGIVGPNGCGKSNVIDAVRWVLGESKASALRGESMQDVIFNGAGERKPVSRASVELVFDNSLGRASGQWSQFAELSIKRVLSRDGDSKYYINNLAVRRRDITDLFLGTGLGPRAYAIIEQGMISRIIEAKPEELRVFLEEAAGVSKYKERRKETEGRLADARENLSRVEDIRGELGQQLEKLEVQAKVAAEYREFEARLTTAQRLLWFSRQQDAARARERATAEVARHQAAFESLQAELRNVESQIETLRAEEDAARDAVNRAQGEFYGSNAEVQRLEQQLSFHRESQQRLAQQLAQAEGQVKAIQDERAATAEQAAMMERQLEEAAARRESTQEAALAAQAALAGLELAVQEAARLLGERQTSLAGIEQARQVTENSRQHANKALAQLAQRRERLLNEQRQVPADRAEELAIVQDQWEQERAEVETRVAELEVLKASLEELQQRYRDCADAAQSAASGFSDMEARAKALAELQAKLAPAEDTAAWLERQGLAAARRLWQVMVVTPGWEDALEAVLRERLNAVEVARLETALSWAEHPGKLAVYERASVGDAEAESNAATLYGRIKVGTELQPLLATWLAGIRCAENLETALAARHELGSGEVLVTPAGHLVSKGGLCYFAPDSELHGVLARQRELAELETALAGLRESALAARQELLEVEAQLKAAQAQYHAEQQASSSQQRRCHDLEMELVQLKQAEEAARRRREQIARELAEVDEHVAQEHAARDEAEAALAAQAEERDALYAARDLARHGLNETEVALARGREALRTAEHAAQEARFMERASRDKAADLHQRVAALGEQLARAVAHLTQLQGEHTEIDWTPIERALQEALMRRQQVEQALAGARDREATAGARSRQAQESRLLAEQKLDPARNRIEEARVKESVALTQEEQFAEQLREAGADMVGLPEQLQAWGKPSALPGEIERLQAAIVALGAVNLAALEELQAAQERKDYLDRQAADLNEAIDTLESAIRRIDKETRALLQTTYDTVNHHFGELFPALFGGGQARLLLTGEEILDAGVQVLAQPPGKRNSSIHLLSGGEKALTALALVFAMFQLNPAPFCLLDEVDAPLDDPNTDRFCAMVKRMALAHPSGGTQFLFISHNKITMEMANQLIGVTMAEPGVSRVVAVDIGEALQLAEEVA